MGYRAVALSQVDGADAESVGADVARQLGFGYLNEAIVAQVARDHGVDPGTVAGAERRKSFLALMAGMSGLGAWEAMAADPSVYVFEETGTLLGLIRDAVLEAADRGSVVLVAHAACYACADRPDVLRVWVTAPLAARTSRVAAARGISEREAARVLHRSDAGRASYLKRVYGVAGESPADYDLVINTGRIAPAAAAGLIAGLVQAPPPSAQAPVTAAE